jgi:hypothetical protein
LRIYGIISSPALISLGGFRVTRSRISLELPLGEKRVRNQELVILRKKEKE